jgi:hypothetical protein
LTRAWVSMVMLGTGAFLAACSSPGETLAKVDDDPQACASCHMDDFSRVRKPPHIGQKPTTCGICHKQADWHPSILNHSWPLTGAHANAASCFECHKGDPPEFRGTPKLCFGCHAADYQRGPDHVTDHYPTTCEVCHSTAAWKPILASAKVPPKTPVETTSEPKAGDVRGGVRRSRPALSK